MTDHIDSPALEAAKISNLNAERRIFELEASFRERKLADEVHSLNDAQIFHFFGPVNQTNCSIAIEELGTWSRKAPNSDITVVFNSPGGTVFDGLALFDYLRDLQRRGHKVVTKAIGKAESMGSVLLQAGTERIMSKNAFILIHEISGGAMGKASEMEDSVKLVERLQTKLLTILADRSTLSPTQIKRRWTRKDWYLDAEEALSVNFIDRIEE